MYEKVWSKNVRPCIYLFSLIKLNIILRTRINKYVDIGSPSPVPLSDLKYFVVNPPFMMHDSWLFNKVCMHLMNLFPNPYLFKAKIKKLNKKLFECL